MSSVNPLQCYWNWKFGEWSLHATGIRKHDENEVIEVQWKDNNNRAVSQPLFIVLDDGPECLRSLAEFVAAAPAEKLGNNSSFLNSDFKLAHYRRVAYTRRSLLGSSQQANWTFGATAYWDGAQAIPGDYCHRANSNLVRDYLSLAMSFVA